MRTRHVLLPLAATYAVTGLVTGFLGRYSRVQDLLGHLVGVALIAGIYVWCRSDMLRQSPPRSGRWALWSALCPPVVLPVYLFRTRSPGLAAKSVAKGVAIYVGLTVVFVVAALGASLFSGT